MSKILLVEDDTNLSEIYAARLQAEGFEVVSAYNGEEALATAVKEQPDLIILDVMMPKISGFDVLDILRQTPETKNTRVIMMTALSQSDDRERGKQLGADKYLVKSQVTLEDVVASVREVLDGKPSQPQAQPQTQTQVTPQPAPTTPPTQPSSNEPQQKASEASSPPQQVQSSQSQSPQPQPDETNQQLESEINQILGLNNDEGGTQSQSSPSQQQPVEQTTDQTQPPANTSQQASQEAGQQNQQKVQPGASVNLNDQIQPQQSAGNTTQPQQNQPEAAPQDKDDNQQPEQNPDSIAL